MKHIYFVRHAESDYSVYDDLTRPLTDKGMSDSKKITMYFDEKDITRIFSSPYKRAVDTIKDLAEQKNLDIKIIEDFKERKISDIWIKDFHEFSKNQWEDFDYKLPNGESLNEVQKRNKEALIEILESLLDDENIVVGTHGTALSTIINYYDNDFKYDQFDRLRPKMPHIICLKFEEDRFIDIEEIEIQVQKLNKR